MVSEDNGPHVNTHFADNATACVAGTPNEI